ncbi:MAG: tryptophan synthase subunit alpha [Acidobacteria bacterium ACB1]|nr:Tryptophan synthase alpha chain [Pyrinomonadaceae bacterium]MCE7962430.1 tryptophan synthase subunit alpha [Acidobacteria bacterium ACB1]RIJ94025.1 MAG: tryptophan synthase subunit alpha [Acidobacteriota bacterium]
MSDRITENLKNGRGFIPFVTAGDPDDETSLEILKLLAARGANVIELGVPFSDPMADGVVIQRSSQRALDRGVNLASVLSLAAKLRVSSDVPLVLFSYLNPILRFGIDGLCSAAKKSGVDGILIVDAVDDEARELADKFAEHGISLISLVSPTTSDGRLENICRNARGFIYAVSRAGVTGAANSHSNEAELLAARVRKFTDLPIAVGFGISTAEQVENVWKFADAAVVGSAIVAEIEASIKANDALARVEALLDQLLPLQKAAHTHKVEGSRL